MSHEIDQELAIEKCLNSIEGSVKNDIDLLLYALNEGYAGSIGLESSEFKKLLGAVDLLREEKNSENILFFT